MSSSTERRPEPTGFRALSTAVLRGCAADGASKLATPELRDGAWTRFGDTTVLGDVVTEQALAGLAQTTRQAARAQGYAIGWAQGRQEASTEAAASAATAEEHARADADRREAEHRAALDALHRATLAFDEATRAMAAQLEDQALGLARDLTEVILGHELRHQTGTETADAVARRVLAVLPSGVAATVRLHPDVAAAGASPALETDLVHVVADATLSRHDAVVTTDEQVVDLSIAAALTRVREALS